METLNPLMEEEVGGCTHGPLCFWRVIVCNICTHTLVCRVSYP